MRASLYAGLAALAAVVLAVGSAGSLAQEAPVKVLIAMDPADEASGVLTIAVSNTPLPRLLNQPVAVIPLRDLRDVMCATRTGENDVIIAPAHVDASALAYNCESLAASQKECAHFVPLVSANTDARSEGYFRREWNLVVGRMLDMADDQAFLPPAVIDGTAEATARELSSGAPVA